MVFVLAVAEYIRKFFCQCPIGKRGIQMLSDTKVMKGSFRLYHLVSEASDFHEFK